MENQVEDEETPSLFNFNKDLPLDEKFDPF
jgi:hypothetical protein